MATEFNFLGGCDIWNTILSSFWRVWVGKIHLFLIHGYIKLFIEMDWLKNYVVFSTNKAKHMFEKLMTRKGNIIWCQRVAFPYPETKTFFDDICVTGCAESCQKMTIFSATSEEKFTKMIFLFEYAQLQEVISWSLIVNFREIHTHLCVSSLESNKCRVNLSVSISEFSEKLLIMQLSRNVFFSFSP